MENSEKLRQLQNKFGANRITHNTEAREPGFWVLISTTSAALIQPPYDEGADVHRGVRDQATALRSSLANRGIDFSTTLGSMRTIDSIRYEYVPIIQVDLSKLTNPMLTVLSDTLQKSGAFAENQRV